MRSRWRAAPLLVLSASMLLDSSALDCASFDLRKIQLITFDLFAALMDTQSDLTAAATAELGVSLTTPAQVQVPVDSMIHSHEQPRLW